MSVSLRSCAAQFPARHAPTADKRICPARAGGFWAPYLAYMSVSLAYAVVAGSLVAFVEPLAGGSGIPEVCDLYHVFVRLQASLSAVMMLAVSLVALFEMLTSGLVKVSCCGMAWRWRSMCLWYMLVRAR